MMDKQHRDEFVGGLLGLAIAFAGVLIGAAVGWVKLGIAALVITVPAGVIAGWSAIRLLGMARRILDD